MELRLLGTTGLRVSLLGLGCNNFGDRLDLESSRKVVHQALDLGVNFFDTADTYGRRGGSEDCLGQILGSQRRSVVLATKFGLPMADDVLSKGASRRYIMLAVEASLRRLRTDWIDLYQLHFPDPTTPIEETLRALDDLIHQGKVRYIGCSNFAAWQLADAHWTARRLGVHAFVSSQNAYNILLLGRSRELLQAIEAYGMGLVPAYPLSAGLLTGKYQRGQSIPKEWRLNYMEHMNKRFVTERNWSIIERLQEFAAARDLSLLELSLAWLTAQRVVASIIAGAMSADQLESNFKATARVLAPTDKIEADRIVTADY